MPAPEFQVSAEPKVRVKLGDGKTMPLVQFMARIVEGQTPIEHNGAIVAWAQRHEPIQAALHRQDLTLSSMGSTVRKQFWGDFYGANAPFDVFVLAP